jgi:hypothetical protein
VVSKSGFDRCSKEIIYVEDAIRHWSMSIDNILNERHAREKLLLPN